MACIYTTDMYLNIGTDICASISASRSSGSTNVHFDVTFSEDQQRGQTYYSWNTNAIKAAVDGYTGWITVKAAGNAASGSASTSFDINVGNYNSGSRTFDIIFAVFNNAESGTVGGIPRFQVSASWGASATQPSTPSVSIAERYTDGAKFNVSISSYGSPGSASGRYIEAAILNQNTYGATYKFQTAQDTASSAITVRDGSYRGGTLSIKSNTKYYYGGYASNTVLNKSTVTGQFITLAVAPVASNFDQSGGTATFDITEVSDGAAQTIQLQYRYKKHSDPDSSYSSWANAGSAGNHQTESVTLSGLPAATAYDVQVRAQGADSSNSSVNTYVNAFTTDDVTISIASISNTYIELGGVSKCRTTINYIISAAGVGDDATFDIVTYCTYNGATYNTYQDLNGTTATGSFVISDFPLNTEVELNLKAKLHGTSNYGTLTTQTITTPNFTPGAPTVTYLKWGNYGRYSVRVKATAATPGEDETFYQMRYRLDWYDASTNTWQIPGWSYVTTQTLDVLLSAVKEAESVPKYRLNVWQVSKVGTDQVQRESSYTTVVFQNRPRIYGVMISPDGTKQDVVGVRTKSTDGTLNHGCGTKYAEHAVVIK